MGKAKIYLFLASCCLSASLCQGIDASCMEQSFLQLGTKVSEKRQPTGPEYDSTFNIHYQEIPRSWPWYVPAAVMSPCAILMLYFAWLLLFKPSSLKVGGAHLDKIEEAASKSTCPLAGSTFVEIICKQAAENKKLVALRTWSEAQGIEEEMTYNDLAQAILSGAEAMQRIGVSQGDRVAFFCKGTLDFFVSFLSVQALGATPVLLNWRQSKENLQGMIEDSGAVFLVLGCLHDGRDALLSVTPEKIRGLILLDGEAPKTSLRVHRWSYGGKVDVDFSRMPASKLTRSSEAAVFFTSGSTSRPKPVLHLYDTLLWTAENFVFPEDTKATLSFLPNFHVIMVLNNFLLPLSRGFCVSIHAADGTASITADMLLKATEALEPTVIDTVPFIMEEWSSKTHDELAPLRRCALVQSGGAPLSTPVAKALLEASVPVRQHYG